MSEYIFRDYEPDGFSCSENITVPNSTPYEVYIDYVPKYNPSPDIFITGLTRVVRKEYLKAGRYHVDFRRGILTFHSSSANQVYTVTYTGLGTFWRKRHVDDLCETAIYLAPEYDGAVQFNDGGNNTGILSLGHDATSVHNYYNWLGLTSPDQDTDIVIRFHIPNNWGNFRDIKIYNKGETGTHLSVRLFDTQNVEVDLVGNTGISNPIWTETIITL